MMKKKIRNQGELRKAIIKGGYNVTDKELFLSESMANYAQTIVDSITKRYKYKLTIVLQWDDSETIAYTDGDKIVCNVDNIFARGKDRATRAGIMIGLLVHECGHVNHTDFPLVKEINATYQRETRLFSSDKEVLELEDFIKKNEKVKASILELRNQIDNCLEDGYVDKTMIEEVPGYGINLKELSKAHCEGMMTFKEYLQKNISDENILVNNILHYAKAGYLKADKEDINYQLMQDILSICPIIDEFRVQDDSNKREQITDKVLCVVVNRIINSLLKNHNRNQQHNQNQENQNETTSQDKQSGDSSENREKNEATQNGNDCADNSSTPATENNCSNGKTQSESEQKKDRENKNSKETPSDTSIATAGNESNSKDESDDKQNIDSESSASDHENEQNESEMNTFANSTSQELEEISKSDASTIKEGQSVSQTSQISSELSEDQLNDFVNSINETTETLKPITNSGNEAHRNMDKSPRSCISKEKNSCSEETEDKTDDPIPNDSENEKIMKKKEDEKKQLENMLHNLCNQISKKKVEKEQEDAINDDLQKSLEDMKKEKNTDPEIKALRDVKSRIIRVNDKDENRRKVLDMELRGYINRITKEMIKEMKDRQSGGMERGLYSGTRFIPSRLSSPDKKLFGRNIAPEDFPDMCIAILVDMSGSTRSHGRMEAERKTAYILYSFCHRLDIPCAVYGFCSNRNWNGTTEIFSFSEFDSKDGKDLDRISSMDSQSASNRDGYAVRYVSERLAKRTESDKIMIILSDGQPNDSHYGLTEGKADIRETLSRFAGKNISYIAAAIGDDAMQIKDIYSNGLSERRAATFLNITDLDKMPKTFIKILKKKLEK